MGKHIVAQRRGHGSLTYQSPSHRHITDIKHLRDGSYKVDDIIQSPGRNAPLLCATICFPIYFTSEYSYSTSYFFGREIF